MKLSLHLITPVFLAGMLMFACSIQAELPQATATVAPTATTAILLSPTPKPTQWTNVSLKKALAGKKLTVATAANYPPWENLDEQSKLIGFDIDLIQEIGKRGNVEVEIQDLKNFDDLLPAVEQGKIQAAIGAIVPNNVRRKQVDFSIIYLPIKQAIVAAPDSTITITDPKQIGQYTVGVQTNTALDSWVINELAAPGLLPLPNLHRYESAEGVITAIEKGTIKIGLLDARPATDNEISGKIKIILSQPLTTTGPAIAMRKIGKESASDLKLALDEIIAQLQNEGYIQKLAEKYTVK